MHKRLLGMHKRLLSCVVGMSTIRISDSDRSYRARQSRNPLATITITTISIPISITTFITITSTFITAVRGAQARVSAPGRLAHFWRHAPHVLGNSHARWRTPRAADAADGQLMQPLGQLIFALVSWPADAASS